MDADTRVKYQAESEDVPQKLKIIFLCQSCFVALGFIIVVTESDGLFNYLNFELFLLFLLRTVLRLWLFLRIILFLFFFIGKIEVGMPDQGQDNVRSKSKDEGASNAHIWEEKSVRNLNVITFVSEGAGDEIV